MFVTECFNCDTIELTLSNEADSLWSNYAGSYVLTEPQNDKQAWKSSDNNSAIWHFGTKRVIGSHSNLGNKGFNNHINKQNFFLASKMTREK